MRAQDHKHSDPAATENSIVKGVSPYGLGCWSVEVESVEVVDFTLP